MRYKIEVIANRKIRYFNFSNKITNPTQIVRQTIEYLRKEYPNFDNYVLLVANDEGRRWRYSYESQRKYPVQKMERGDYVFNKDELSLIFSGNMTIFSKYLAEGF